MGKKQRSKLAKASTSALNPQSTVQKYTRDGPFNFLGLPRECRDTVYEELLVSKLSTKTQAKYDKFLREGDPSMTDYKRWMKIEDFLKPTILNPGYPPTLVPLKDGIGLLSANKKLREESSKCLFSKNTFEIVVDGQWGHYTFWSRHVTPRNPDFPETMSRRDFGRIEHLNIYVQNYGSLDDPVTLQYKKDSELILKGVVEAILQGGNKLKTLKVHYVSCFKGAMEEARAWFEFPSTGNPKTIFMIDCNTMNSRPYRWDQNIDELYRCTSGVLDCLKDLRGQVEDFQVGGELRLNYIYELTEAVLGARPSRRTILRHQQEKEAKANIQRQQKPGGAAVHAEISLEQFHNMFPPAPGGQVPSDP